ncbi:MAG: serine/threonine protein kinase [Acidobacteria bacterium]|nr:serine/threonine protein kinase [Acidobacteriota bacterium]
MERARWEQIQALFHETASLPASEWKQHLEMAAAGDSRLVDEVLVLLKEDAQPSLLDKGIAQVAGEVLHNTQSPTHAGDFGSYRIIRVVGEGGMGIVYLAERKEVGGLVAIKVLRDAWLSPSRRERFAAEQHVLAQLNHPSIARLYDADTLADGTPWFVMEYVDGIPITDYCRRCSCSLDQRLRLFRSVCEAVQYAHAHAVIHRDLKPSNIFVNADGTVRLLDFGISKQLESLDAPSSQTMTGLRLLTPAYAAPEQIRGDQVGVHTDVYALGVILFELLTDQLPFDLSNLTPAEATSIVVSFDPGKPSSRNKRDTNARAASPPISRSAWADVDTLCLTAMHKDPQRRYRSVEALIRDIDHYLEAEPLEARPDSIRYKTEKFVRRNWQAVSASAAVVALLFGLTGFFTWRLTNARNAALAESERTQRIQRFMIDVFQGGDAVAGPAAELKVIDMLDRGAREAKALDSDPKVKADLLFNFAEIYEKQGQFEKAEPLFQSALEQRKHIYGTESTEVAEALTALALMRADQSRLDEAERLAREAMTLESESLDPGASIFANATITLGKILGQKGQHEEAIRLLNAELERQSGSGAPNTQLTTLLSALADVNYNAGHYEVCVPLYKRLIEMHRQIYGPNHPLVAGDFSSLGATMIDLGYYDEAETYSRQALDLNRTYYGADNPKVAANLTTLGRAFIYEKKYDQAADVLGQALSVQMRLFGPVHSSIAETLNELGNVASMRNQLDDAEAKFRRVVEIYRSIYGDHHSFVAIAMSNVASIRMDKKDYAGAERIYRDVVQRFSEALSADNVNTGIARVKLGRTLLRESRFGEAEAETLAGYKILQKQTEPSTSFLRAARRDLVTEYEALKRPTESARFRAELVSSSAQTRPASVQAVH